MGEFAAQKAKKRPKPLMIVGMIVAALVVVLAIGLVWVGNFFYDFALNPNSSIGFSAPEGLPDNEYTHWLLESSTEVYLTGEDGLKLHGYAAPGDGSHRYAILCHGYQNNASGVARSGQHFSQLGYGVLLPDARGHGKSEGDYIGMGWHERRDIIGWANSIISADPQASIVLYGVSMGAATVMMASGEGDLPPNVRCIIEDCGYTSARDEFAYQLKRLYKLPPFPIISFFDLACRFRAGYSVNEASAVSQVAKSHTPTLFIHGEKDSFVPYFMLDTLYNAAACPKEKLSVPGADHVQSVVTNPQLYWSTAEAFLAKYMP